MMRGSKLDEILTLLFMLLAIGTVVCFFLGAAYRTEVLVVGGIAVAIRIVQYILIYFY